MNETDFLHRLNHVRRVKSEADFPLRTAGKPAGVLIPIVRHTDELTLLLTRRALHLRHHPGQISFPGGRMEADDKDATGAALRETHEEIGIPADKVEIVGRLPEYRTISGYAMQPVIGLLNPNLSLAIDENEVEDAFEVSLSYVLDRDNHYIHWVERGNYRHPIYFIPYEETYIWGATAALIRTLSNHIVAE